MLTEAFALALYLPPLAFGPLLPAPLRAPRELSCAVRDLGRVQGALRPTGFAGSGAILDPRGLRPRLDRNLVNPAVDFLLVVGTLAATRGSWDNRSWGQKAWEDTRAVTPALIPPLAPPPSSAPR